MFNDAVSNLAPEGYADVKKAFVKAFQLLEKVREEQLRTINKNDLELVFLPVSRHKKMQ